MFELYKNDDTFREQRASGPEDTWLESSADGLLTLEAEKFLLSLPFDYVPGTTALIRPDLINRIAREWHQAADANALSRLLVDIEAMTYAFSNEKTPLIKMELQVLRAWLQSSTESVKLFIRH
jgi:hypothetical protein